MDMPHDQPNAQRPGGHVARRQRIAGLLALALSFGAHAANAQTYEKIPIRFNAALISDESFQAARDELLAIVIRNDRAALNKRVGPAFFWERDHGGMFKRKNPPARNLAAATSWKSLRSMLSAEHATPRRAGSSDYCLPAAARPRDEKQFDRVAAKLDTDTFFDWGVIASEREPVRASPEHTSAELAHLSQELVRVTDWAFDAPEGRPRWVAVVTSNGSKGFVDGRRIQTLAEERLCLRKDADGVWRISGFIGGGD
jgi:hypothetical protein